MAYTLNQGIDTGGLDRVQRALLVGLPAIVLVLTIGALMHRGSVNNPAGSGAKVIPIVSTLGQSTGSSSAPSGGDGTAADTSAPAAGSASLDSSNSTAALGGSTGGATSSGSSATSGVVGGRGGGPTTTSQPSTSATLTVPPLDLQAASKQLVSSPGTTVTVDP